MSVTTRDLMTDPELFGGQFGGESWAAWRALLAGFYGLELSEGELAHWQELTGRESPAETPHSELWLAIGRRGGKSQAAALLAVFESAFSDYTEQLSPGEVATAMVLAADRKQARTVMRYVSGLLHANPMLERMILREDRESIELTNRTVIEVHTASFRAVRGYTVAACIADEIAFWRSDESANPDREIIAALRPAMATLEGKLIALSSPYSKRGALWDTYRRHFGKPGTILVAQAASRTMNPKLPERVVSEALERDPQAAAAEYLGQFRNDLEQFISRELIESATRDEALIIPRRAGVRYVAFVDVAGGGADEYTLAIAHRAGEAVVVDAVHAERGDPAAITARYAEILKGYGINRITGDRYAADWPVQEYRKHGITLAPSPLNRSELFLEFLPALQTGRVDLPPDDRMVIQFASLERRTGRTGRDSVNHPPGGHDDRANAVAGACYLSKAKGYSLEAWDSAPAFPT